MSDPFETTEAEDVREFLADELGQELEEGFLVEEATEELAAQGLVEETAPVEEEQVAAPEEPAPEAPPLPPVSEATKRFQEREAKRQEKSQVEALQAEIESLRAQQQQAQPAQQQAQPVQPEDPEPDRDDDEASWFEWRIRQVEKEKDVIKGYILHRHQQEQLAMQQQAKQAQAQQEAMGFIQTLRSHEQEWDQLRPGYYDRSAKVVDFLKRTYARSGGSPEQVNEQVQHEIYGMLYRAQAEGRPPAAVIEDIYDTMAEVMGLPTNGQQQPQQQSQQQSATPRPPSQFEKAQQAQRDGATGTLSTAGGGLASEIISPDAIREGSYSSRDAQRALDKMGTEDYLEIIRRAGT